MPVSVKLIPPAARDEWLRLSKVLDENAAVPCCAGDAAAWWPDRNQLDSPATRGAITACRRCPAEAACLAYAMAAHERFGVWGGTIPDERRPLRRG